MLNEMENVLLLYQIFKELFKRKRRRGWDVRPLNWTWTEQGEFCVLVQQIQQTDSEMQVKWFKHRTR